MTIVALASAKGSPGVSASALLLAALWPQAVLLEADAWGGDLHYRLTDESGRPLRPDLGVVSLLSAHNRTGVVTDRSLSAHAQQLPGGLSVVVGPGSPAQVQALRGLWPQLASAVAASPHPVVLDSGRVDGHSDSDLLLLRAASRVLLVCRPDLGSLVHTRDLADRLAARSVATEILLIGGRAQRDDAARALGAVSVHLLPDDPAAAGALLAGQWTRKLDRSALLVAARQLVSAVAEASAAPEPTLGAGLAGRVMSP
jgi:hypothetical protein